jgi:hypothetical protein
MYWLKNQMLNLKTKSNIYFLAEINNEFEIGGASRDRTDDLLRARQALSQLSYDPS